MKEKLNLMTLSKEEQRKTQGGMPCGGYCNTTCGKYVYRYEDLQDHAAEKANRRY